MKKCGLGRKLNIKASFYFIFVLISTLFLVADSYSATAELKILNNAGQVSVDETSVEKNMSVSQQSIDSVSQQNPSDKKDVGYLEISNTNKDIIGDNTYKSNETASKAIEKSIVLFTDRLKERFSVWLERSARYVKIMKDILKERGLPEELVFLPIVESGFNLHAYSPARAVGPWQFIAATAKRYGLIIDWWRDERKDPVKSTQAAASYLKDLYSMFGSWNLALAAYNAGEGRIMRSLKKSGEDDYWGLIEKKHIPRETMEYVPRYIAATNIANAPEDYGFYDLVYHEPLEYDEVTINTPIDIEVIARCAGVSVKEIRELNPELRRWSTPPDVDIYTVRIPIGTKETFLENLKQIPENERFSIDIYKAKKGDTFKTISRKTGIPVNVILAINSMSGIEKIKAGDIIKLPPKGKYFPDIDDKLSIKKASYKKKSNRTKNNISKKKRVIA